MAKRQQPKLPRYRLNDSAQEVFDIHVERLEARWGIERVISRICDDVSSDYFDYEPYNRECALAFGAIIRDVRQYQQQNPYFKDVEETKPDPEDVSVVRNLKKIEKAIERDAGTLPTIHEAGQMIALGVEEDARDRARRKQMNLIGNLIVGGVVAASLGWCVFSCV